MLRVALFEPDIPQNAGAIFRLASCFGIAVDIIEPCGFVWSDTGVKRVAMDYTDHLQVTRHTDWEAFHQDCQAQNKRLVLLTVRASEIHYNTAFSDNDILLFGRESSGVPDFVHAASDLRVRVPMTAEVRSLNLATTAAVVLSEAVRQVGYAHLN